MHPETTYQFVHPMAVSTSLAVKTLLCYHTCIKGVKNTQNLLLVQVTG